MHKFICFFDMSTCEFAKEGQHTVSGSESWLTAGICVIHKLLADRLECSPEAKMTLRPLGNVPVFPAASSSSAFPIAVSQKAPKQASIRT